MNPTERIDNWKLHDSIRGEFSFEFYKAMAKDARIWLVVPDLGYGVFDAHFEDFPDRCVNCGAAEQLALGIAIGLSMEGKIPFVYSITSFLIFRPFEWIRNYLQYERAAVRLIGSGLGNDYAHDGITHQPSVDELGSIFDQRYGIFTGIEAMVLGKKEPVADRIKAVITMHQPSLTILRR